MPDSVSAAAIAEARQRIAGQVLETPSIPSPDLSRAAGVPVHLKLESRQLTGSFKLRGATNALLSLAPAERARGVVAASTGNHGRGLAEAARASRTRCVICMSNLVPANKVEAIQALGAEVHIVGRSQDEAQEEVERLVAAEGLTMLPPFDHAAIIAGQGTIGLELVEQVPDVAHVIVPLSGGGLIAGVAAAVKATRPRIRVTGVSMARGAAMHASVLAKRPVTVREEPTLADSLGGGIGLDNRYTLRMVGDLVDDIVLLEEAEIAAGIRHAYWREQEIVEGAGAVGIAALLAGRLRAAGPAVLVVSGKNIDMQLHHRIVSGEDMDPAAEAA